MSSAIVLAAGLSSRMGCFKPLLPFGGSALIAHTVARLREGGVEDVIVVTGFLAPEVEHALDGQSVRFVHNPDYAVSQMFDSVKLGLAGAGMAKDLFLLPADLPQFAPKLLRELLETEGDAAHPVCGEENGHPLLVRRWALAQILRHDGQRGLKGALDGLCIARMKTEDCGCLMDVDTPEEYQRLLAYRAICPPTPGERVALLHQYQTPEAVVRHCEAVRSLALQLAEGVPGIDLALLNAAAQIHDAARTQPNHALVLARELTKMGYRRMAEIVGVHMDLPIAQSSALTESSLLYLADKMIVEDQEVSLWERFNLSERKFAGNPEALSAIHRRKAITQRICSQLEQLHRSVDCAV